MFQNFLLQLHQKKSVESLSTFCAVSILPNASKAMRRANMNGFLPPSSDWNGLTRQLASLFENLENCPSLHAQCLSFRKIVDLLFCDEARRISSFNGAEPPILNCIIAEMIAVR